MKRKIPESKDTSLADKKPKCIYRASESAYLQIFTLFSIVFWESIDLHEILNFFFFNNLVNVQGYTWDTTYTVIPPAKTLVNSTIILQEKHWHNLVLNTTDVKNMCSFSTANKCCNSSKDVLLIKAKTCLIKRAPFSMIWGKKKPP